MSDGNARRWMPRNEIAEVRACGSNSPFSGVCQSLWWIRPKPCTAVAMDAATSAAFKSGNWMAAWPFCLLCKICSRAQDTKPFSAGTCRTAQLCAKQGCIQLSWGIFVNHKTLVPVELVLGVSTEAQKAQRFQGTCAVQSTDGLLRFKARAGLRCKTS